MKSLEGTLPATLDVTLNRKAFTILVRNEAFRMVRALSSGDFEAVVEQGEPGEGALGLPEIEARMKEYLQDHARIQTDPKARAPANTIVSPGDGEWKVQQVLVDPEGHNDWGARAQRRAGAIQEAAAPCAPAPGNRPALNLGGRLPAPIVGLGRVDVNFIIVDLNPNAQNAVVNDCQGLLCLAPEMKEPLQARAVGS